MGQEDGQNIIDNQDDLISVEMVVDQKNLCSQMSSDDWAYSYFVNYDVNIDSKNSSEYFTEGSINTPSFKLCTDKQDSQEFMDNPLNKKILTGPYDFFDFLKPQKIYVTLQVDDFETLSFSQAYDTFDEAKNDNFNKLGQVSVIFTFNE